MISNSVLLLSTPSLPSLISCYIPSVHLCVCVCVCVCKEHGMMYNYYFWSFNVYIFIDLLMRGVLTIVDEIWCYRNDHYNYLFAEDEVIRQFLSSDGCCRVADKVSAICTQLYVEWGII